MRKTRETLARALPLVAALSAACLPLAARAAMPVFVDGDAVNPLDRAMNTNRIIQDADLNQQKLTNAVQDARDKLYGALQSFSSQMTVNQRAAVQAQSQMMDTWDARETQRRIVDTRIRGITSSAPGASVCNVITGSITAQSGFNAAGQWREEITHQQLDFFLGASPNTAARNGAAAAMEQRNQLHCQLAATQFDVDTATCPSITAPPQKLETGSSITPPVGRDLNANTLLDPAQLTFSDSDKALADVYLLHAFGGDAIGAIPNGAGKTEAGRALADRMMTSASRISVAHAVGAAIAADRAAMPGTGGTGGPPSAGTGTTVTGTQGTSPSQVTANIASWAEGTAKQTIGYNPQGGNFPNGVSRAAYLKLRAMAWFWNPNWAMQVGAQSSDQTMKDIAYIQAYAVYQNWELYQQIERMNLTLATMLSIMEAKDRPAH